VLHLSNYFQAHFEINASWPLSFLCYLSCRLGDATELAQTY
jgi:hypothetical protein